MKKIFRALILLMPFVLFSCFEFAGGANMSKRMLNLAIAAPGDVAKLHIGVFDSAISTETMIYNQTIAAGSSIPLDLPVGNNRIILVWAEGFDGIANYYGSVGPVTIDESGDSPLPIRMIRFDNIKAGFSLIYNNATNIITWNAIPGALTYEFGAVNDGGDHIQLILTGISYDTTGLGAFDGTTLRIRVITSVFNLLSDYGKGTAI